jgi:hypothetical protein
MSKEDLAVLMKAAAKIWAGAILTRSGIVLALAKIGAEKVLKKSTSLGGSPTRKTASTPIKAAHHCSD